MSSSRTLLAAAIALAVAACTETPTATDDVAFAKAAVSITGGGITLNNNSGFGAFVSIGGFNAQATGPAVAGVFPATGQVQAKSVPGDLGRLHAVPVCITNLGPSIGVDGGGDPDTDVWEIRIQITRSTSLLPVGSHGSIFVQDNGRGSAVDFADENFDPAAWGSNVCGITSSFHLEPVLQGSVTVRD